MARAVTGDSLAGALGGYLLAGVVFSHLYCALEIVSPRSFRVPDDMVPQLTDPGQRPYVFNYYSFVTLTSVGYGDILPVTQPARSLSCVEAVVGQFYMATVIAGLVGVRVSQRELG